MPRDAPEDTAPALADYQRRVMGALLSGQVEGLTEITNGSTPHPVRLLAYQTSVYGALEQGLLKMFSGLCRQMGEGPFMRLVVDYVPHHMPSWGGMANYAFDFPDFLASHPLSSQYPDWVDMARYEVALRRAAMRTTGAGVTTPLFGGRTLTVHPSLYLLDSPYPLDAWHADTGGGLCDDITARCFAIWQTDDADIRIRRMQPPSGQFLRLVQSGVSAADALAEVCLTTPAADFKTMLSKDVFPAGFASVSA